MHSTYFGLFVQIFDLFSNKMINIKKEIKNFEKFERYIGNYCGIYPDFIIIKLLDNLTLNSLIFVYPHLKSNRYLSNYNMNLLEHVDQTLKREYQLESTLANSFIQTRN